MFYKAGLDVGSVMAKAVIMNENEIVSYSIIPIMGNFYKATHNVLEAALEKANLSHTSLNTIGTTGLGASFLTYTHIENTEVACQARGMNYLFPYEGIIVEIGNQSTRVIKVTVKGRVADCVINDRCAAGSGRILQIISKVLRVKINELGDYSIKSTKPVMFSTGCSVFVETEAVSRIAEGSKKEDIIAGLHHSMSIKILSMIQKVKLEGKCAITGGGAKDLGLVKMLEQTIGKNLFIPYEPFITGAIGAAIISFEKAQKQ